MWFSAIGCNLAPVFVATFLFVQTCGEISVAAIHNTYSNVGVGRDVKPAPTNWQRRCDARHDHIGNRSRILQENRALH